MRSDDVRSLAAILIQADKFGSSIAQALRVQSDSMRVKTGVPGEGIGLHLLLVTLRQLRALRAPLLPLPLQRTIIV